MNWNTMTDQQIVYQLTFLPVKEARNLCKTNQRVHNICSHPKYDGMWKDMIKDTFGTVSFYQEMKRVKPNLRHHYRLYTDLVKMLPYPTQENIYEQQGDMDSYNKVVKKSERSLARSLA